VRGSTGRRITAGTRSRPTSCAGSPEQALGRPGLIDLRRFLDDKPIRARRPTPRERLARWLRRHKAVVRAVLVVLLLAVAGLAACTWLIWKQNEEGLAADSPRAWRYEVELAACWHNLGEVLGMTGAPGESESALRRALDLRRGLVARFPGRHPYRAGLAGGLRSLGDQLAATGRPRGAHRAYRRRGLTGRFLALHCSCPCRRRAQRWPAQVRAARRSLSAERREQ
jgi:hypothetical protein